MSTKKVPAFPRILITVLFILASLVYLVALAGHTAVIANFAAAHGLGWVVGFLQTRFFPFELGAALAMVVATIIAGSLRIARGYPSGLTLGTLVYNDIMCIAGVYIFNMYDHLREYFPYQMLFLIPVITILLSIIFLLDDSRRLKKRVRLAEGHERIFEDPEAPERELTRKEKKALEKKQKEQAKLEKKAQKQDRRLEKAKLKDEAEGYAPDVYDDDEDEDLNDDAWSKDEAAEAAPAEAAEAAPAEAAEAVETAEAAEAVEAPEAAAAAAEAPAEPKKSFWKPVKARTDDDIADPLDLEGVIPEEPAEPDVTLKTVDLSAEAEAADEAVEEDEAEETAEEAAEAPEEKAADAAEAVEAQAADVAEADEAPAESDLSMSDADLDALLGKFENYLDDDIRRRSRRESE